MTSVKFPVFFCSHSFVLLFSILIDFKKPTGFGNSGMWRPHGLNGCLKLSRYEKGQVFKPHFDGPWVPIEDDSSNNYKLF